MNITMENVKKYFGEIDFTNEALIKQKYKELVKKYHPDTQTGDEEKFKELDLTFKYLKSIQPELKAEKDSLNKKIQDAENSLLNIERDLSLFKRNNDEIISEIKTVSEKINNLSNYLSSSLFYIILNNRTVKQKIIDLTCIFIIFGINVAMFINIFNISTLSKTILDVICCLIFLFITEKSLKKIKLTKKLLLRYKKEKKFLDSESSRLEKRICALEIKKIIVSEKLNTINKAI